MVSDSLPRGDLLNFQEDLEWLRSILAGIAIGIKSHRRLMLFIASSRIQ